ncbi:MAG TPA: hypothetical protein VJ978_08820 [Nitriliruptoraceae bacterium]|nr:hypothetical protein [Nitriliruptoraceae bacterium]
MVAVSEDTSGLAGAVARGEGDGEVAGGVAVAVGAGVEGEGEGEGARTVGLAEASIGDVRSSDDVAASSLHPHNPATRTSVAAATSRDEDMAGTVLAQGVSHGSPPRTMGTQWMETPGRSPRRPTRRNGRRGSTPQDGRLPDWT